MGMVKEFLGEYCEAIHPDDYDAQDALFEKICEGSVMVPMEEMQAVIGRHRTNKLKAEERSQGLIKAMELHLHEIIRDNGYQEMADGFDQALKMVRDHFAAERSHVQEKKAGF